MFNSAFSRLGLVLVAATTLAACGDDPVDVVELDNIAATAAASSDLSTLSAALEASGLVSTLEGEGPFTVFAPVNSAFDAGVVEELLQDENSDILARVLTFHVVPGAAVFSGDLTDGQTVTTVEGGELTIGVSGGSVTVNGAAVVTADIEASNGVVHLIDEMLVPSPTDVYETAVLTPGTTELAAALLTAQLDGALQGAGPFTVFAPVNAAFDAVDPFVYDQIDALAEAGDLDLLSKILTFHVIAGAEVFAADLTDGQTVTTLQGQELTVDLSDAADPKVNGVSITTTDIQVENGVIHLVDEVIFPDFNVVETAILTESTQTLAAAVDAAGLGAALSDPAGTGESPFTVFVPVDAAFEALGTDRLDVLLDPANQGLLQKILTYHVIPGAVVEAGDLSDGQTATTLAGVDVTFDLSDAQDPKINGVSIIATDIAAENGIIHLIDGVLTQNLDIVDVATLEGFSTLVSLVEQQGLTSTLRGDNMGDGYTVFAPTNDAFAALSAVPTGDDLTNVLLYHVVGATVESSALSDGQVVGTAYSGHDITVNINGSVTITDESGNTVNVVLTDVPAANGIIHVIDAVLIPTP